MISYREVELLNEIKELWNSQLGFIFPISEAVFNQNVINYKEKIVYGAYEDNILVGFIIGKSLTDINYPSYNNIACISLFFVSKKFRRNGIGSTLLKMFEEFYQDRSIINIGKDFHNFFPGLPCDFNNLTDIFLEKRGYEAGKYVYDVINLSCKEYKLRNSLYEFKVCTLKEKDALLEFMKNEFPGGWFYQVNDYFLKGGTGNEYVIALDNDKVISFSRINDRTFKNHIHYNIIWANRFENLFGIGPLGVSKLMRGKDLGYDIVAYAINIAKMRGFNQILIDWTDLLDFYQQFEFEVWKSYKYMSKRIEKVLQK